MNSKHSTSSEPDISDLIDLLAPIADRWIIFGSLIKVERNVLGRIDKENNDSMNKLYRILGYRLDQEPPLTWHDIVQALKSDAIYKPDLASKIESQYISPQSSPKEQPSSGEPLSTQANSASSSGALLQVSQSERSLAHVVSSGSSNVVNPTSGYGSLQSSTQQSQFQCYPMYNAVPQSGPYQPHHPMPPSQLNSLQRTLQSVSNPHAYPSPSVRNPWFPQMAYQRTRPIQPRGFQPASGPFYSQQAMSGRGLLFQQGLNSQRPPQGNNAYRIISMQPQGFKPASGPFYPPQTMGGRSPFFQQGRHSQWPFQGSSAHANLSLPQNPFGDVPPAKKSHTDTEPSSLIHDDPKAAALYETFRKNIKTLYRSRDIEKRPEVLKLSTPGKMFINLAFIDRRTEGLYQSDGSKTEYDEITEAMVRDGNVDAIRGRKCPIDFNSIAANMPDEALEKVILVEGAPGVGKSTFAWEFCRRWERGEIARQYDLVLLLRLRDNCVCSAKSLKDLIYPERFRDAVVSELESNLGVNVLFILEGYDELPDTCRRSPSLFLELINGQLLPLATIMVTSRPWATYDVRKNYNHRLFQHIEVLGFTRGQIMSYIHSVLPNTEAADLKQTLKRHPQITMCMYIPLNCAIVVTVYKESKATRIAMPTTLTGIYTALAHTLLLRYLKGNDISCNQVENFEQLPPEVHQKFCHLCKLAYDSIAGEGDQTKLIFTHLPRDFDSLGFMDSVFELYNKKNVTTHNFLHLTFQEYLAAVYISMMGKSRRLEIFRRYNEGRLRVVLKFLAGLTKFNELESASDLYPLLNEPTKTKEGHTQISYTLGVQVSWLLESQRKDLIKEAFPNDAIVEYFCDEYLNFHALGYCIVHSQCQWVLSIDRAIENEDAKILLHEINLNNACGGVIVGLRGSYGGLEISLDGLNILFEAANISLQELQVELPADCSQIFWPDLSRLHTLTLEITPSTCSWKFGCVLHHSISLKTLEIIPFVEDLCLAAEDWEDISQYIATCTSLKKLSFSYDGYFAYNDSIGIITKALANNHSLQLEYLDFSAFLGESFDNVDDFADYLSKTTSLLEFSLPSFGSMISIFSVLKMARALTDKPHLLNSLFDRVKEIEVLIVEGDRDLSAFVELIKLFPEMMKDCDVVIEDISNEGLKELATIKTDTCINILSLKVQEITSDGAKALAEALSSNIHVGKLYMSHNEIDD